MAAAADPLHNSIVVDRGLRNIAYTAYWGAPTGGRIHTTAAYPVHDPSEAAPGIHRFMRELSTDFLVGEIVIYGECYTHRTAEIP